MARRPPIRYESPVAKRPAPSRIPSMVGALPVVGGLARTADAQAKWMQDMVEQNARLLGRLPDTIRTLNDSIERFNQTVQRLDRAVTRIETASKNITGPLERAAGALDPRALREIPESIESLRTSLATETVPALRAATDTQRQVALLQSTVERVIAALAELPGAGIFRRMSGVRSADAEDRARSRPSPDPI